MLTTGRSQLTISPTFFPSSALSNGDVQLIKNREDLIVHNLNDQLWIKGLINVPVVKTGSSGNPSGQPEYGD